MSGDPELDEIMGILREQILLHGGGGIQALRKKYLRPGESGDRRIDLAQELPNLLADIKILLSPEDQVELARLLDRDGNGSLEFDEFLFCLAPHLNPVRTQWVNKVFDKLDKDKDGLLTRADFARAATTDPRYNDLCRICDRNGSGSVDNEEFINYYRELSPGIDRDDDFIAVLLSAWKL
jgi:Ca2+-binding EF-hand superfamily protein